MHIFHHGSHQPRVRRTSSLNSRHSVNTDDELEPIDEDEVMQAPSTAVAMMSPRLMKRSDSILSAQSVDSDAAPMSPFAEVNKKMQSTMLIAPEESVYSYLMFMPPVEHRRYKKKITPLIVFAVLLVIVNFVMQTGLLYVVGQHIMKKHNEWVSNLATLKHVAWYHVIPMDYNRGSSKCLGEDSPLCSNGAGGMSCAPRTVEVLADWNILDIDGDEIWSREEAEHKETQDMVQCKFNVDLPSLYRLTVENINRTMFHQGGDLRDTNLRTGVGIHKAYHDWYLHRPLLCQYGDQDMCGTLFMRGFFDEALRQQPMAEFKDTASAFKYCTQLLERECFDVLPNTYRVWRNVGNQQCGLKKFGQSIYRSPSDDEHSEGTSMLTVDFKKRIDYESSKRLEFKLFLIILLVTFTSVMSLEMRSILKTFIWTWKFPTDTAADRDGKIVGRRSVQIERSSEGDSEEGMTRRSSMRADDFGDDLSEWDVRILGVRDDHRRLVFVITVLRLLLWIFLLWSGIMFLTGPPRYLALIFDALSLVFILEIDELLYRTMLRTEFKNDHGNIKPIKVQRTFGGDHGIMHDIVLFLCIIAFSAAIVTTYSYCELNPLVDSLQCLCTVEGQHCNEARVYSKPWWNTYWSTTMPAASMIIQDLKAI